MRFREQSVSIDEINKFLNQKVLIELSSLKLVLNEKKTSSWVTIAVLVEKSVSKKSKNGKTYQVWKLSDLKKETISLFLFSKVLEKFWTLRLGSVLAISDSKPIVTTNVCPRFLIENKYKCIFMFFLFLEFKFHKVGIKFS
jgi:DNA polymerase III alpha subunit